MKAYFKKVKLQEHFEKVHTLYVAEVEGMKVKLVKKRIETLKKR